MDEILAQVKAVRQSLGWFDRSAFGMLTIVGRDRYSWLQGMISNDVKLLANGLSDRLSAFILDPTGHVIADITLIDLREGALGASHLPSNPGLLLETPPGLDQAIWDHLDRLLIMEDAEIANVTGRIRCVSLQGLTQSEIGGIERELGDTALTVTADHTGSGGIDVYIDESRYADIRDLLNRSSAVEIGPTAQEILRIEAGIPKFGVDMDQTTLAPEVGVSATHISLTKGCYVGQEIVARIDSRGHTNRALTGLVTLGETVPTPSEKLYSDELFGDGKEVGWITSVAACAPSIGNRPIALGYVRHEHRSPGTWLRLGAPDSQRKVEVAELPFYRKPAA